MINHLDSDKIKRSPKIDLHRHLLGSARLETLWDLGLRYRPVAQRSFAEFKSSFIKRATPGDLAEYIKPWKLLREVIRDPEDIRRVAAEAAEDARLDGVLYVEFRNSLPGLLITDGEAPQTQIPTDEYLHAVQHGFNEVANITCRLIASVPRHAVGAAAAFLIERYADRFFQAVMKFRGSLIVGVDLTGIEKGWPASLFKDIFVQARRLRLPITIHAGETEGPEEVWTAIDELGATRIGHGTSAPADPILVNELISRNVVLEVCPTSGWLTGAIKHRSRHPVINCIPSLPYVICTDNPTLNASTLSRELTLASEISGTRIEQFLGHQLKLAAQAAFAPETVAELIEIKN